jgi:hypothetical protein
MRDSLPKGIWGGRGNLEISDGRDGLRIRRVAENILDKQLRTTGDDIQGCGLGGRERLDERQQPFTIKVQYKQNVM